MTTTYASFDHGSRASSLRRVRAIATIMDTAWRIPGTRIRFGADAILGLIPGAGDLAALGISLYAVGEAVRLGVPRSVLIKMLANIAIDTGLGAVPIIGDVFDIFFKSNMRNLELLLDHLNEKSRR